MNKPLQPVQYGQRLHITLLVDVWDDDGETRTHIPAGTVYDGVVAYQRSHGFFILFTASATRQFCLHDPNLRIGIVAWAPTA